MAEPNNIQHWSARRTLQAFADGEMSAEEYAQELLSRCSERADLNAFVTLDAEDDLKRAGATAPDRGRLAGLPIALKDAIGTVDLPTTAGTPALANHRPKQNAEVVRPLVDAGAFVFGKLNMHELSYGITSNNAHHGPPRNPLDTERIAGGSSGGAAVAVSAGMVPVALGTDTGGSVRIPAALCGVVGFRPSAGRNPQRGIVPVSHTRDTADPICRTVDDAALIDAAITGTEDRLETLDPSQLRIGLPNQHFLDELAPETRSVFEARVEELRAAGWSIVPVDVEGIQKPEESCGFPIAVYETKTGLAAYLQEFAPDGPSLEQLVGAIASPDVRSILGGLLAPEFQDMAGIYQDALTNGRPRLQGQLAACFEQNRLDALMFPTTVRPAALIGKDETVDLNGSAVPTFPTFIHNTDPGSIAGIPGISVPAGLTASGLPVGIDLDGPVGSDRHLLAVAHAMERALPQAARPTNN